jgi:hypothetical protein
MSGSDGNYGGNRDIKKLLGNPKITFVLGKLTISQILELKLWCRWTRIWKGNSVCQIG